MNRILAIALKDIKLLIRDRAGLFWVLGMPVLMALFFGSIFGSEGPSAKIPIVIVDEDRSPASQAFVTTLDGSPSLDVDVKPLKQAQEFVRKGDKAAYLRIPKGFGEAPLFGPNDRPPLEITMDPRRKAESGFIQGILTEAWFKQMQGTMQDPEAMKAQSAKIRRSLESATAMDPARKKAIEGLLGGMEESSLFDGEGAGSAMQGPKIALMEVTQGRKTPATAFEVTFPQGVLWGLIGVVTAFALAMVRERTMGTLQRLQTSPLTRSQLLAGKGLACFLTSMAVIAILLVFGMVLGVRTFANPPALLMALVGSAFGFSGIMMFLSVLGKTENSVSGAGWGVMLVFSMLGGGMIPLMVMPDWMFRLSSVSPVKWAILSMEGAIWRGFSLVEMLIPFGVLMGIGALFFGVGVLLQNRQSA